MEGTAKRRLPKARCTQHARALRLGVSRSPEGVMNLWSLRLRSEQRRMSRRTDQWIGNDSSTMTIAGKAKVASRVLAQECEVGRMRAVSHCQRAAQVITGLRKGRL